jgi:hypothetical protein
MFQNLNSMRFISGRNDDGAKAELLRATVEDVYGRRPRGIESDKDRREREMRRLAG